MGVTTSPFRDSGRPVPFSFATTRGIAFAFFSCPYLKAFVRGVSSPEFTGVSPLAEGREVSFGHPGIEACTRLPRAFRSLLRPSSVNGAKGSTTTFIRRVFRTEPERHTASALVGLD